MFRLRRLFLLSPIVLVALFGASCGDFWVSESSIKSVTTSPAAILLKAGASTADSYTLSASATTQSGTTSDVTSTATWTSSNSSVATVSAGTVTCATSTSGQTATITATDDSKSGTTAVLTYTGTAPTSISLTYPATVTPDYMYEGEAYQMTATATLGSTSTDITKYVAWSSSNTSVATVSSAGYVTISSTATVGSSYTITATVYLSSGTVSEETGSFYVYSD